MRKHFLSLFLLFLASGILVVAACFVALVNYIGIGYCPEGFVQKQWAFKQLVAQKAAADPRPRLFVFSGSNGMHCIDGEFMEELTGLRVVNMAIIWLQPMRFYLADALRYVRAGDVIYLPLELPHYCLTAEKSVFSDIGRSFLFGINSRCRRLLSVWEYIRLYGQFGASWIDTVASKLLRGEDWICYSPESAYEEIGKDNQQWPDMLITESGGRLIDRPPVMPKESPPFSFDWKLSDEFLSVYARIKELARERGAKVVVGFTNQYPYMKTCTYRDFTDMLSEYDIHIQGRPEAFCFPYRYYYDGNEHANRQGARLHTYEAAKVICRVIGREFKVDPNWPQTVFADSPWKVCSDSCEMYEHGVRCVGKIVRAKLNVPPGLNNKPILVSVIADFGTGGSNRKLIRSVQCNGQRVRFSENAYPAKNEILVAADAGKASVLELMFELQDAAHGVGLERAMVMSDDIALARDEVRRIRMLGIRDFDDVTPGFVRMSQQHYVYRGRQNDASVRYEWLRFRIPNFKMADYKIRFALRFRDSLFEDAVVLTARSGGQKGVRKGGCFEFEQTMNQKHVLWDDGAGFVGVMFPIEKLQKGDEIELVKVNCELLDPDPLVFQREETVHFDFCKPDEKISCLCGCTDIGEDGMWTDGKDVIMRFRLDSFPHEDVDFEFALYSVCPDQRVSIAVGDRELACWNLRKSSEERCKVVVPKELVVDGSVTLTFRILKTVCPKELGLSSDPRRLGVRFVSAEATSKAAKQ